MISRSFLPLRILSFILIACCFASCKKGIQVAQDEVYSRHLQRQVKMNIYLTPMPDDKSEINLLLFNDGEQLEKMNFKDILDSLFKTKQLQPAVIIGVQAVNRMQEYGIADKTKNVSAGEKADHYDSSFNNELYPFAKKKAGVRKFKSVTIAGFGAGGLSAFDIGWTRADKIAKVGVFSGAFNRKENAKAKEPVDSVFSGLMHEKIKASRKRPELQFWLYSGEKGNTGINGDDAANIAAYTHSLVDILHGKNFITDGDIVYTTGSGNDLPSWKTAMPGFLTWALGK